jgi:mRNA interferase MazF
MPIKYPVARGTVVLCDYSAGFRPPEMVKRRPAVVISPRLPHRDGLCTVVPLSGSPPAHEVAYQCRIELAEELPPPFAQRVWWAKADMLATVGYGRLDLFRTGRDQESGRRRYVHPRVSEGDLKRVLECVINALGLSG